MAEAIPIPEPPGLPILGNLGEFTASPMKTLMRLADTYGETILRCSHKLNNLNLTNG